MMSSKKQHGQFFTVYDPFKNKPFEDWWNEALESSENKTVLEPFAGANNLIYTLKEKYSFSFKSFDIEPKDSKVSKRDTLKNFPKGYNIVVTNPPYLAKNSAKRSNLFSGFKYDDLYKDCLEVMLKNVGYVAAIIPASFLHWGKLQDRLYAYVMLTEKMFDDTDTPVCLALFKPSKIQKKLFYLNSKKISVSGDVLDYSKSNSKVKFNDTKSANIAMCTFDNTKHESIRFMKLKNIDLSEIKDTSRNIVCVSIPSKVTDALIAKLNTRISEYRKQTKDVFMTPFKGVRKDGNFRRRMSFRQARAIITEVLHEN